MFLMLQDTQFWPEIESERKRKKKSGKKYEENNNNKKKIWKKIYIQKENPEKKNTDPKL